MTAPSSDSPGSPPRDSRSLPDCQPDAARMPLERRRQFNPCGGQISGDVIPMGRHLRHVEDHFLLSAHFCASLAPIETFSWMKIRFRTRSAGNCNTRHWDQKGPPRSRQALAGVYSNQPSVQVRLNFAQQLGFLLETDDRFHLLAALEQHQRGDAHNAEGHRRALILVHIELADGQLAV